MRFIIYSYFTVVTLVTILPQPLWAIDCPLIRSLADYNCDGRIRILITGDSVVSGVGDEQNAGGYVGRLQQQMRFAKIESVGIPGAKSLRLFQYYRREFRKVKSLLNRRITKNLDYVVIDVGRNDYWDRAPAKRTTRNILRLVHLLRETLTTRDGMSPFVIITTLIPTNRSYQSGFITQVNDLLLRRPSTRQPVYIRFNNLSRDILSSDGLHPCSYGYDVIAQSLYEQLYGPVQEKIHSSLH